MLCRRCGAVLSPAGVLCVCCTTDMHHEGPSTAPNPAWARRPRRPITRIEVEA